MELFNQLKPKRKKMEIYLNFYNQKTWSIAKSGIQYERKVPAAVYNRHKQKKAVL